MARKCRLVHKNLVEADLHQHKKTPVLFLLKEKQSYVHKNIPGEPKPPG